jgi:hypothetical protein
MTDSNARAECQAIYEELKAKIDKEFAKVANEEYYPVAAWVTLYGLRRDLLPIYKKLEAIAQAREQGDRVVPFKT